MTDLLHTGALVVTVLGLLSATVVLGATRRVSPALGTLLDFLLAAGLLRLSADAAWSTLLTAALVIAVRKLVVSVGLRPRSAGTPSG